MIDKLRELKWKLHCYKHKKLLIYGLNKGLIRPYDDNLIQKLRTIYYGALPASIILLSDGMTNGHCYDRALLISRAFLDEKDDVQLIYASIDSLKLNPRYFSYDARFADHSICERITEDGKQYIYDTSSGFVYDKKIYWLMENPIVRKINNKQSIIDFINGDEDIIFENLDSDKYAATLILPMIENAVGRPNEMYAFEGIELLQREIEHYKKLINYDEVVKEIDEDMKRVGLKK